MSKKKKRNRVENASGVLERPDNSPSAGMPPTLLDEVLSAPDGRSLAKDHLARRPEILFFAASATFQQFSAEELMNGGFELPPVNVLDYLEFATRALGMPEVANLVKQNFPAALLMYEESMSSLDGESITRAIANAKGMGFLMA